MFGVKERIGKKETGLLTGGVLIRDLTTRAVCEEGVQYMPGGLSLEGGRAAKKHIGWSAPPTFWSHHQEGIQSEDRAVLQNTVLPGRKGVPSHHTSALYGGMWRRSGRDRGDHQFVRGRGGFLVSEALASGPLYAYNHSF